MCIDKEAKQNAVNFKREFLLNATEEILRFKVNGQMQTRVGGQQEMDCGCKSQEKSIVNSSREKSQQQTERTRRSASPTSSQGVW